MESESLNAAFEASCVKLRELGVLGPDERPVLPSRRPEMDDEMLGVSFFRTLLSDVDLSGLVLPRTFFGRSEVRGVIFRGGDLSESWMCWNNFIDVDFSGCRLSGSNMGGSEFERVSFAGADLRRCEMRHGAFIGCVFTGARMDGARLVRSQARALGLSVEQTRVVDWQAKAGDMPEGG